MHVYLSIREPCKQNKGAEGRYRVWLERDIPEATEHVQPMPTPLGLMFRARKDVVAEACIAKDVPGTGKTYQLKAYAVSLEEPGVQPSD